MQDVYAIADNVPHTTRHRICAATMQSRGARTTPASEKTTLRRIRTPTPPNSTILQASSRLVACLRTTAMSERAEQSIRPGARGRAAGCELHWCQHVYLCGLVITWECVRMIRYDRASGLPSPTNGLIKNASKGGQKVFSGHTRPHSLHKTFWPQTPLPDRYFTVKPLNAIFFISTGSLLLYLFISTDF